MSVEVVTLDAGEGSSTQNFCGSAKTFDNAC